MHDKGNTAGELLRKLRKAAGWTQGEAASILGCSTAHYSELERDRKHASVFMDLRLLCFKMGYGEAEATQLALAQAMDTGVLRLDAGALEAGCPGATSTMMRLVTFVRTGHMTKGMLRSLTKLLDRFEQHARENGEPK